MGTILLSCVCDLIVEKLCGECRSVTAIREAGTNCHDVCIVFAICVTVILVALIVKCAIGAWKDAERKAADEERKAKEEKEKEESERKIKSDLLNKYLDCLKDQTDVKENEIKNEKYRSVLEYLIELSQRNELNKISDEKLKSFFSTPKK